MPMPMRGLSSFLARRGRSSLALTGEPATIPRSAGGGVALSGRLDAAAASKISGTRLLDAPIWITFAGRSSSTKTCAGCEIGLSWISKTAVSRPLSGFAGKSLASSVPGNVLATRSLYTQAACAGSEIGLSWIPKTAVSRLFSGYAGKSLVSSVPGNLFATRSVYTQAACTVGDAGLSRIPKAASSSHISPFGVKSLHSSFPAIVFALRGFYTQSVGGPPNRGGSVFRFLTGLGCFCGGLLLLSLGSELGAEPVEPGIDWVKMGCTPPVVPANINSGGCGCCWAIIAVQNVESVLLIQTGKFTPLSIQEIIDCCGEDSKGLPYGCSGGFMSVAFNYMKKNGLSTDLSYPINLIQRQGPCLAADKPRAVQVLDWEEFPGQDDYMLRFCKAPSISVEDQFMVALFKSPISVRFQANGYFARFRGKSIIEYDKCPPPPEGESCNHAVLLVGFGTDHLGNKFWLIQNVWGKRWGNNGYARVRRGVPDPRGVGGITAKFACRPIVKMSS